MRVPTISPSIHKKNNVFRRAKGFFMHVKCAGCNTKAVCYSHSQKDVRCSGCSAMLLKSSGGRATILDNARVKRADNTYELNI